MKDKHEIIGDVRGHGLFIGVEIVKDKKTKERGEEEAHHILEECFHNGLLVISAGRNTLRVIPPLNITREELDEGLEILEEAVAKVDRLRRSRREEKMYDFDSRLAE